jgi:histidine triad (HIT) family protein
MTLFSKIINGDIPCAKLYEDDHFFSFLDIRPIKRGHALVVPKLEVDYIFDLPDDLLSRMLVTAKPIARAIEAHVPCERIGLMVAGLEVPHCHLHLVPIRGVGDLNFSLASEAEPDDLQTLAAEIRKTFLTQ